MVAPESDSITAVSGSTEKQSVSKGDEQLFKLLFEVWLDFKYLFFYC